jgi:hypothetical protein
MKLAKHAQALPPINAPLAIPMHLSQSVKAVYAITTTKQQLLHHILALLQSAPLATFTIATQAATHVMAPPTLTVSLALTLASSLISNV